MIYLRYEKIHRPENKGADKEKFMPMKIKAFFYREIPDRGGFLLTLIIHEKIAVMQVRN